MMKLSNERTPISTRIRHHRRCVSSGTSVAISVLLGLLLASVSWLYVVFPGSGGHHLWRELEWEGSPSSFPWQPDETQLGKVQNALNEDNSGKNETVEDEELGLKHIVFGIAGSASLWKKRKEFVKLWWRPEEMRGNVWLEEDIPLKMDFNSTCFPTIRVSEDTSGFRYMNPTGHPSGLRIARILQESFRLGLPGVRWFVLGDDDTIFNPDNLVRVLNKYDHKEMFYIGGPSESHSANSYFSHMMAFGGGGIAISYPLAEVLSKMQDECLERYLKLYGSDDRLHACISEIGVPLTREYGFHQWDIRGSAHGLLSTHPIAPFISIHHVEAVDPLYPGLNTLDSLKLFTRVMKVDPMSFLQRAICYDRQHRLTYSVSMGYVVQVFPDIVFPRDLERSEQSYVAWNWLSNRSEFDFDMRDPHKSICKNPVLFFLKEASKETNTTFGTYRRVKGKHELKRKLLCFPRGLPLREVREIQVAGRPLSETWHLSPRRLCCKADSRSSGTLNLLVGQCEKENFLSDFV